MTAPRPEYMTTAEVAARFRTTEATVRYWRYAGTGPKGTKFGTRVLYDLAEVDRWEQSVVAAEHGAPVTTLRSGRAS